MSSPKKTTTATGKAGLDATFAKADLVRVFDVARRFSAEKGTYPILSHFRVSASGFLGAGSVRVDATDIEVAVSHALAAEVAAEGSVVLPAKRLLDVAKRLRDDSPVRISVVDKTATLRSGKATFEIVGFEAADFPSIPAATFDPGRGWVANADVVRWLLAAVVPSMSEDSTRPHLSAVLVLADPDSRGKLLAVSTDGHRLTVARHAAEGVPAGWKVLLPARAVPELDRFASDVELVRLESDDAAIYASKGEGRERSTISAKHVEASFPPYEQVVPKGHKAWFEVSVEDSLAALRRVMAIVRNVKLSVHSDHVTLDGADPELGRVSEDVDAVVDGASGKVIGLNAEYFSDALRSAGTTGAETAKVWLSGELDPARVDASGESGEVTAVVMPMRI